MHCTIEKTLQLPDAESNLRRVERCRDRDDVIPRIAGESLFGISGHKIDRANDLVSNFVQGRWGHRFAERGGISETEAFRSNAGTIQCSCLFTVVVAINVSSPL